MVDELDFDAVDVDADDDKADLEEITPIKEIGLTLDIVLGETTMPIHELLRLGRGAVISLNRDEDDDISIYAGDQEVACGQLRLNGERIEVVVTDTKLRGPEHRAPSDPFKKVA